jgi:hypothetical protein
MEYKSKHPIDVLKWIEKVIDSCQTYQQLSVADNLVDRCYINMYLKNEDINTPLYQEWTRVSWKIVLKQYKLISDIIWKTQNQC